MTERQDPDQPTLDLLRQAVELHCRTHTGLGPVDSEEWFFTLARDMWAEFGIGQWKIYVRERQDRVRAYQKSRR